MKRVSFFMVASIAITFASCTKEMASDDLASSASQAGKNSTAAVTTPVTPVAKLSLSLTGTNYGALIDGSGSVDPYTFETDVAGKLGLSCLRDNAPVPGVKKVKTLSSAYNILLNFTSTGVMPMKFRTDTTVYKTDLQNVIASLGAMPKIAIVENEESNKGYYSGTADDYIKQLRAAITVMHSYGIPVTNGGITSTGLKYLVYQDYMNRGMVTQANDYKKRMHVAINNADTKERGAYISVLISAYATMNLDYVNFHWRSQSVADAQGLGETIDYLQRATGKKVITTEIGQYDQDPATLTSTVQMCKNYNFPYLIWYSGESDGRSFPLQYESEVLTTSGVAYQSFIKTN